MYEFFVSNPIVAYLFIVIVAVLVVFLFVKAMQKLGLEKVREIVYQGFITAEHSFLYGDNKEKLDYVVMLAHNSIPRPFNIFITENVLRKTIQLWFDLCKDLLDDGKINTLESD